MAEDLRISCLRLLDRKSTRLNSSHTVIYTLSLHDALPIYKDFLRAPAVMSILCCRHEDKNWNGGRFADILLKAFRSEEHTSELQSHSDLHSFPTRRSSDLQGFSACPRRHEYSLLPPRR